MWAKSIRQYIALQDVIYLERAIAEAENLGETGIADALKFFASENLVELQRVVDAQVGRLNDLGRDEERDTLLLIKIYHQALLTVHFKFYELEEQMQALQLGFDACRAAVELCQALNDEACEAIFLALLAHGLHENNQSEQALTVYAAVLEKYRNLAEREPPIYERFVAMTINNTGIVQKDLREFAAAEISYKDALGRYKKLARNERRVFVSYVAGVLNNLGVVESEQRKFRAAEISFTNARKIYAKLAGQDAKTFATDLAMTLNNLGLVQRDLRDFEAAEHSFNEALKIRKKLAVEQPQVYEWSLATTLNNLGTVQRDMGKFEAAESSFSESLEKYQKLANAQPQRYSWNLALTFNNLGTVKRDLRKFTTAKSLYTDALKIYRALTEEHPQIYVSFLAATLNNLGIAERDLNEFEAAENSFVAALEKYQALAESQPDIYEWFVATTFNNLGLVRQELPNSDGAEDAYKNGLTIAEKLADEQPEIYQSFVATILDNLGNFYISRNEFEKAIVPLRKAQAIVKRILENFYDLDLRKRVFQQNINIYNGLLVCYFRSGRWEEALEIAEQGKSRSLTDLINLKLFRPKYSVDDQPTPNALAELDNLAGKYEKSLREAQQLESHLISLYRKKSQSPEILSETELDSLKSGQAEINPVSAFSPQIEKVKQAQENVFKKRAKILRAIKKYDPQFPPRVNEISRQEILELSRKSKRAIVVIRVTDGGTFILIVFPNGEIEHLVREEFTSKRLRELMAKFETVENENGEAEERLVGGWFYFYDSLVNYQTALNATYDLRARARIYRSFNEDGEKWLEILKALYSELLIDVRSKLKARKCTDVLFVPNGALAVLPLHSCCWKDEKGKNRYLLDEFTISYATNVSVFKHAWDLNEQRQPSEKCLFVTNPDESLRFADREVDQIMKTFQVSKKDLRHGRATKKAVKTEMTGDYGFLHFSCHGNYDWREAFSSRLMLADGELTMKEIMEMNLPKAWLVTLSACETGFVNFIDISDEHYGFPLGFVFAGCPSVWGTLWSVNDKTTFELMKMAYDFIKKGESKVEALRRAQLKFRKKYERREKRESEFNYALPYFWAGFQHFGA